MKRTVFLLTFFLVISILINLSFIFDKMKNEENVFVEEKEAISNEYCTECAICKLFIRDLNSHWYAQNGLSKDEVLNFLEHYSKSLPLELSKPSKKMIEENMQALITQILSGKPPFEEVCNSLLGCD